MKTTKQGKSVRIIPIVFLVLSNLILYAQLKTEAYFGVSNRMDYARDIIEYYDNGFLVSAGFEWEKGWNIKIDKNLLLLWDKTYEFPSVAVHTRSTVNDSQGNTYVCGSVNMWPFVTKLDSCGNKVWCKILQYEDEFDHGNSRDILISQNNKIVLLTRFDSEEEINMIHLIGLSLDGDVLWKKPYASKNDYPWIVEPSCRSLLETNNEYYITGKCYWPFPDDTTHLFLRPLFIGIDSLFDEKWILPFYALDSVFGEAYKTIALNDSVFMGAGVRSAYGSNDEYQALLMFYNKDGVELGYNEINNDQIGPDIKASNIKDIVRIDDTIFITASQFGPDYGGNPLGELIIDTAANLYNFQSRPNTIATNPSLIKTFDGKYVMATNIQENKSDWDIYVYKIDENLQDVPFDPTPHTYDSLCPGSIQSSTIDLTNCLVWTNVGDAPSPKEYYESIKQIPIKAYPNPVSDGSITFEFKNTEHHRDMELRCFNIFGELVHKERVYRYQGKSVVDLNGWSNGIYVGVVYSDGIPAGRCKFLINN